MNKCQFCKKKFTKESTLIRHLCEPKRRYLQKDERHVRLGFMAWKKFMDINGTKIKSVYNSNDFMKSSLYLQFCKFGRYLRELQPEYSEKFIDFLIIHHVKLDDWTKEYPYNMFIKQVQIKESPDEAIARSLKFVEKHTKEKNLLLNEFFIKINTNLAVQWIQTGRISPWLIYCASTSQFLLERMSEEQRNLLHEYLEPARWKIRLKKYDSDVKKIRSILKECGI